MLKLMYVDNKMDYETLLSILNIPILKTLNEQTVFTTLLDVYIGYCCNTVITACKHNINVINNCNVKHIIEGYYSTISIELIPEFCDIRELTNSISNSLKQYPQIISFETYVKRYNTILSIKTELNEYLSDIIEKSKNIYSSENNDSYISILNEIDDKLSYAINILTKFSKTNLSYLIVEIDESLYVFMLYIAGLYFDIYLSAQNRIVLEANNVLTYFINYVSGKTGVKFIERSTPQYDLTTLDESTQTLSDTSKWINFSKILIDKLLAVSRGKPTELKEYIKTELASNIPLYYSCAIVKPGTIHDEYYIKYVRSVHFPSNSFIKLDIFEQDTLLILYNEYLNIKYNCKSSNIDKNDENYTMPPFDPRMDSLIVSIANIRNSLIDKFKEKISLQLYMRINICLYLLVSRDYR